MNELLTIGIPQFIFAHGIPNVKIDSVTLVRILPDEAHAGSRPFSASAEILKDMCTVQGYNFKVKEIKDVHLTGDEYCVDVQVLGRAHSGTRLNKNVLCVQAEHVNIMRPSFLTTNYRSLIKRVDLLRRIVVPNRIISFYTLAIPPKRGVLLREKALDHETLRDFRSLLAYRMSELLGYEFLTILKTLGENRTAFFVTLPAKHFGGSSTFVSKIIRIAATEAQMYENAILVIKNHPSDPKNYSVTIDSTLIKGLQVVFLSKIVERTFPIEIMVEYFKDYRFIGFESTCHLALSRYVITPTIIVDSKLRSTPTHREYDIGEIRIEFKHKLIEIEEGM
jgi:hypothetical protein